ncbi:ER membrane protein [Lineolata rhizophorae]|uniref:ER membrane protein n=1 Tax=Lineolata rhizophorae TaxID=578093 RepID=A0A6A6PBW5_9PEZI|nr:ER membrane protein [Lineolata rhizophorae]
MWLTRVLSAGLFLGAIVLTIPLTFDVGGRDAGLAFSLALAVFYFVYSILRLATHDGMSSGRRGFGVGEGLLWTMKVVQWIMIPSLMIWSLNKFSVDADGIGDKGSSGSWVERTFGRGSKPSDSEVGWMSMEWVFGRGGMLESVMIGGWDKFLRWSTPVFQIGEGFGSLLVIQAAGQITRWLVNRERGDSWMIGLLMFSAFVLSGSGYFLWRITTFPEISNIDAILIGSAITCAIFLCTWGIGSGRGNPVESSLLFAYITLCVYQIFTDYQPSNPPESVPEQPALPPLPPIIMASYTTLVHVLSTLPSTIHSSFNFIVAALMTITPSVIISLAYRVFVMYCSARIIPAVRDSGARALSREPSLEDDDGAGQLLAFLSLFSPTILIAVYTSLLMQHFAVGGNGGETWEAAGGDGAGNFWRWINVATTMGLYALELYLGKEDDEMRLTSHWKND